MRLETLLWTKVKEGGGSSALPPHPQQQGAGHACHSMVPPANLENLSISRVCPGIGITKLWLKCLWSFFGAERLKSMFVVPSCVALWRDLLRSAKAPVGSDFTSVKQRSENRSDPVCRPGQRSTRELLGL